MGDVLKQKGYYMEISQLIEKLTDYFAGNIKKAYGSLGGSITWKFVEYFTEDGKLFVRRTK